MPPHIPSNHSTTTNNDEDTMSVNYNSMQSIHTAQLEASNAFNSKDTATPAEEREQCHLRGLMPATIETQQLQIQRVLEQLQQRRDDPLAQYVFLSGLRNSNIRLFYAAVLEHLEEICPIIYTPTVGAACQQYSHIYPFLAASGQPDGLFIRQSDLPVIDRLLDNYRAALPADPQICVITDGSRILGLGDLGMNGMGIPVGKLQLYVAAAGLDPRRVLPVTLDLGTNTEAIREDPFYLGVRESRPDQETFHATVDAVLAALHRRYPEMLIQFEDFSSEHAFELLDRHRSRYLSFNDDIQGTGAVILSGFINAIKQVGRPVSEHRVLFFGAGSAGVGVAKQLSEHFRVAGGLSEQEAKHQFWLVDSKGLVTLDRGDKLPAHKVYFARDDNDGQQYRTLAEVIEAVKPTALVGLSSQAGAFTGEIIEQMATLNEHPIIFPLSNPATSAECDYVTAMRHSANRVIFASGTAFPAYTIPETDEVRRPGQGNNMYIFPGLGLGAVLARPATICDAMIYASAVALADSLTEGERAAGNLYPALPRIREVSAQVAAATIRCAVEAAAIADSGHVSMAARAAVAQGPEALLAFVEAHMWRPDYTPAELNSPQATGNVRTASHI